MTRDIEMEEYKFIKLTDLMMKYYKILLRYFIVKELAEDFVSYEITLGTTMQLKDGEKDRNLNKDKG